MSNREEMIKAAREYLRSVYTQSVDDNWSEVIAGIDIPDDMADFAAQQVATQTAELQKPVPMLLYCPKCFEQHIDEAKPDVCELCGLHRDEHNEIGKVLRCKDGSQFTAWLNEPHKRHRCNFCNHTWRPSDRPTEGVLSLEKPPNEGQSPRPQAFANGKDFEDAVESVTAELQKRLAEAEAFINGLERDARRTAHNSSYGASRAEARYLLDQIEEYRAKHPKESK